MNVALGLFNKEITNIRTQDLVSISSRLLTMDFESSNKNPLLTAQAYSLLRKMFSSEAEFADKKVKLYISRFYFIFYFISDLTRSSLFITMDLDNPNFI